MCFTNLLAGLTVLLLFVCTSPFISAQTRTNSTGTGGIHTIQGKVYSPNGRPVDIAVTVRLEGSNTGGLSLSTNQSGSYAFQNIAPGNYTVVVEGGDNFETARE